MSRQLKAVLEQELRSRYEGVDEACVVDLSRVKVADTMMLRRALCDRKMRVMVVKNSMARRAFADGPLAPIGSSLAGPCALVTGGDSVIDVAREIVRLAKELPGIVPKDALLEGEVELTSVADVAKMKGHAELMGELAMLVASPGRAIAGCLSSPQSKIAGCLKAMADKD